jgi:hypothetical protein
MSNMKSINQRGSVDSWLIAFIFATIGLLAAGGFGVWAYMGRQDYKQNVDSKIEVAVTEAVKINSANKDKQFKEEEKNPLRTYKGPAQYGGVSISYPKTWNIYMDETGRGTLALDGTLNPEFVPGLQSKSSTALRIQVINQQYTDAIRTIEQNAKLGKVRVTPFKSDKVADSRVGLRADGEVELGKQGSLVILPLRDKTLKLWTESPQFVADFNTIILPNLNFVP